jgi:hypothetical protein
LQKNGNQPVSKKRKCPEDAANFFSKRPKKITQSDVDNLVFNHIVSTASPYRSVEDHTYVVQLVQGLQPDFEPPNRRRIAEMVIKEAEVVKKRIVEELTAVDCVSQHLREIIAIALI